MVRSDLFLPQELSNLLISKGFDWEVIGIYGGSTGIMLSSASVGFKSAHHYYEKNGAILWYQAEGFLRQKGYSVEISSSYSNRYKTIIYVWEIRVAGKVFANPRIEHNDHDKCLHEGIIECIKLL